jgi:hypothetical protein
MGRSRYRRRPPQKLPALTSDRHADHGQPNAPYRSLLKQRQDPRPVEIHVEKREMRLPLLENVGHLVRMRGRSDGVHAWLSVILMRSTICVRSSTKRTRAGPRGGQCVARGYTTCGDHAGASVRERGLIDSGVRIGLAQRRRWSSRRDPRAGRRKREGKERTLGWGLDDDVAIRGAKQHPHHPSHRYGEQSGQLKTGQQGEHGSERMQADCVAGDARCQYIVLDLLNGEKEQQHPR